MALKVVANDTPSIVLNLTDRFSNPIDLSAGTTEVTLKWLMYAGAATPVNSAFYGHLDFVWD